MGAWSGRLTLSAGVRRLYFYVLLIGAPVGPFVLLHLARDGAAPSGYDRPGLMGFALSCLVAYYAHSGKGPFKD